MNGEVIAEKAKHNYHRRLSNTLTYKRTKRYKKKKSKMREDAQSTEKKRQIERES